MIYQMIIDELLKTPKGIENLNLLVTAAINDFNSAESLTEMQESYKTLVYLGNEIDAVMNQKRLELDGCQKVKKRIDSTVCWKGGQPCQSLLPA